MISSPVRRNIPLSPTFSNLFRVPLLSPFHHPLSSHWVSFPRCCCRDGGGTGEEKRKSHQSVRHVKQRLSPRSHGRAAGSAGGRAALPALRSSQLCFSSQASMLVITNNHRHVGQGHCSSSSAPRTVATETSTAFPGSSGMAHRPLADIMCPGDLQQHGLLFCRVKWHQQVKSLLQPNTGSFLPTSARNTGLPMSHQHKPQLLTATSYSCSLTLCFNPSAPHHAEVLPKIPARKAKHNL